VLCSATLLFSSFMQGLIFLGGVGGYLILMYFSLGGVGGWIPDINVIFLGGG
jgi:hypothetical protein